MDMNEALALVQPEIVGLESFYTNLMKSRLLVIAGEFQDNPKETKATQEVIDSVHAVITFDPPTVILNYECDHETWLSIMNDGMPAPEVTGGMAKNPDDTEYQSKAAVIGGTYPEGSEAATHAYDECITIAKTLMADDIKTIVSTSQPFKEYFAEYFLEQIQQAIGGDAS